MPPVVIAGGIAAAGTIGGALMASHSQNKAANTAAQAQDQATAAQLQLGQQSLALQNQLAQQSLGLNQSLYNSNYDLLSPFVSRGNVAGNAINSLLGLPNAPTMRSPLETASGGLAPIQTPPAATPAPTTGGTTQTPAPAAYTGPSLAQIYAMKNDGIPGNYAAAMAAYTAQGQQPSNALAPQTGSYPGFPYAAYTPGVAPQTQTAAQTAAGIPQSLQQHAQAAIAAGADPAAVAARLQQMSAQPQSVSF